jgi:hypothetical protein
MLLESGKVDIVCFMVTKRPGRSQGYDFTIKSEIPKEKKRKTILEVVYGQAFCTITQIPATVLFFSITEINNLSTICQKLYF